MSFTQKLVPVECKGFFEVYKATGTPPLGILRLSTKLLDELIEKNKKTKELLPSEIVLLQDIKNIIRVFLRNKPLLVDYLKWRQHTITAIRDRINYVNEIILSEELNKSEEENILRKILYINQAFKTIIDINEFNFKKRHKRQYYDFAKSDKIDRISLAFGEYILIINEGKEDKLDEFINLGLIDILTKRDLTEFKSQVLFV
jgi:hypothetical protein